MAPRQLLISSSPTNPPYPSVVAQPPTDVVSSSITTPEPNILVTVAAVLCFLFSAVAILALAHCLTSSSSSTSAASKGLNKKTLNSFPKLVYTSGAGSEDCAICLAEFADGDEIRLLPKCGHRFHVHCVDIWLAKHSSCPYCRRILTN